MENFADRSAFNAGVKDKNMKTNKIITIVKNQKLATQNFLFNMHINFPFGNTKCANPIGAVLAWFFLYFLYFFFFLAT